MLIDAYAARIDDLADGHDTQVNLAARVSIDDRPGVDIEVAVRKVRRLLGGRRLVIGARRLLRIGRLPRIRSRRDRLVDANRAAGFGERLLRQGIRRAVSLADRSLRQHGWNRGKDTRAPKRKGQRQQSCDHPLVFHDAFLLRLLPDASVLMDARDYITISYLFLYSKTALKQAEARGTLSTQATLLADFSARVFPKRASDTGMKKDTASACFWWI